MSILSSGSWLHYLAIVTQLTGVTLAFHAVLGSRLPRGLRFVFFPCVYLGFSAFIARYSVSQAIQALLSQLLIFSFAMLFHRGSWQKRLLIWFLCALISTCSELVFTLLFALVANTGFYAGDPGISGIDPAVVMMTFSLCNCLLLFGCAWIWKFYFEQIRLSIPWYFLPPLARFMLLLICLIPYYQRAPYSNVRMVLLLCIFFANIAVLFALLSDLHRHELEKEIKQRELQNKINEEYYSQLEKKARELDKLYHDCNNHLLTVFYLIQSQNWTRADSFLKEISKELEM